MGLNINLFVHGVPMGQKVWGPKGDDERYLSSFYGPKWDVPEVMKVDVMAYGGVTYCYYSFVKGQNVFDSQGRAGSYFALTLRMNAFYADAQNMYSILKAAYDKMCVGLCVQEGNGTTKYLLSDFQSVDHKLKEVQKQLLNYISEFSINSDIVSLSGFAVNGQLAGQNINLFECSKTVATEVVKKTGRLMVSPCYLSSEAAKVVAQYKAEMQATKQKAQQEIQLQQQIAKDEKNTIIQQTEERIDSITRKSQEDLRECQEQANTRLALQKEENDKRIAELKETYAAADEKIESLKQRAKEQDKNVSDLKLQCNRKDIEIKALRQQLNKLNEVDNLGNDPETPSGKNWKLNINRKKLFISFGLIMAILLILAAFVVFESFGDKRKKATELNQQNYKNAIPAEMINEDTYDQGKAMAISIKEMNEGKDSIRLGEIWHILIDDNIGNGELKSEDFKIEGDIIIAKRESAGKLAKIYYYVDNQEIAVIEIPIKKDK